MNASIIIQVSRDHIVPTENRAAWLAEHGVLPKEISIVAVADGVDWEVAGWALETDGTLRGLGPSIWPVDADGCPRINSYSRVTSLPERLGALIAARLRADPTDLSDYDASVVLRARVVELAAERLAIAARDARQRVADEAEKAQRAAADAQKAARIQVYVDELAKLTDDDVLTPEGDLRPGVGSPLLRPCLRYSLTSARPDLDCDLSFATYNRRQALRQEQTRRGEIAKEKRQREGLLQIAAWLAEHGTESQKARDHAGRLDVQEVLDAERDRVLTADLGEPYHRLTKDDVPHDENCPNGHCKFTSEAYDGPLTEVQFAALERIEKLAPAGSVVEIREHTGWCPEERADCDAGNVTRLGAMVRLAWGGGELKREYALGE